MTNVKNNHSGLLHVAGVDVRPGATVSVDDKAFENWSNKAGARTWLKLGLIESDVALPSAGNAADDDEDLKQDLKDAAEDERAKLLQEARDLGLNPNVNTGIEKLKKAIAEKKAAQA